MLLTVKLLLGRRCSVQVSGRESVATLKKLVSQQLQVPEERQHLLFRGQRLADDKRLSDYSIGPGASIHVVVRPLEGAAPGEPLWPRLGRVLARHFGPRDAEAVLHLLRREHERRVRTVSLAQLERLARDLLTEEPEAGTSKPGHEEHEEEEENEETEGEAADQ